MEDREIVDLYWRRSDLAISETDHKYGRYCRTIVLNMMTNQLLLFVLFFFPEIDSSSHPKKPVRKNVFLTG